MGPGEDAPGSRGTGGSPWRGVGGRGEPVAGSMGPGEDAPGSRGTGGSPWRGVGGRGEPVAGNRGPGRDIDMGYHLNTNSMF